MEIATLDKWILKVNDMEKGFCIRKMEKYILGILKKDLKMVKVYWYQEKKRDMRESLREIYSMDMED